MGQSLFKVERILLKNSCELAARRSTNCCFFCFLDSFALDKVVASSLRFCSCLLVHLTLAHVAILHVCLRIHTLFQSQCTLLAIPKRHQHFFMSHFSCTAFAFSGLLYPSSSPMRRPRKRIAINGATVFLLVLWVDTSGVGVGCAPVVALH